jgi:MOSC domain-containing protein YiiM
VLNEGQTLESLMSRFPRPGGLEWIGVRPQRGAGVEGADAAVLTTDQGIEGDHKAIKGGGDRQVTLIQWEDLPVVAAFVGRDSVDPGLLRRNLAISGINLNALKNRRFRVGAAVLEGTGYCHPCSRMEENLGQGGYNAMRGHGGITARVIEGGTVRVGDEVQPL